MLRNLKMKVLDQCKRIESLGDAPETEKAAFISMAMTGLYALFLLVAMAAKLLPGIFQDAASAGINLVIGVSLVAIAYLQILRLVALHLRKTNPDASSPIVIHVYLIGQPLMVLAVLNGVPMLITGLLLGTMPALGIAFLNSRHVFYATILIWLELVVLGACVSLGLLPNAPLYTYAVKTQTYPLRWFLVQILMGTPEIVLVLLVIRTLLGRLHQSRAEILSLSRRDGLTDLWNRRYLTELLEHELAVARRSRQPLSLMMVDLDHFKRLNDTLGHLAGDQAIVLAGHILQQAMRKTDHVGRFGGEEFMVVLPACSAEAAREIAECCRHMIATTPLLNDGRPVGISASLGVVSLLPGADVENIDALIAVADKALYQAKATGRNRVICQVVDQPMGDTAFRRA